MLTQDRTDLADSQKFGGLRPPIAGAHGEIMKASSMAGTGLQNPSHVNPLKDSVGRIRLFIPIFIFK